MREDEEKRKYIYNKIYVEMSRKKKSLESSFDFESYERFFFSTQDF